MPIMAKKPTKQPDLDSEDEDVKPVKINTAIDPRILQILEQYREDQKKKLRFKPTQRDVFELALIQFFKAEGYPVDFDNTDD